MPLISFSFVCFHIAKDGNPINTGHFW